MNQLPLGDISLEIFLTEYWQKKPLVIRNAIPNFTPIIDADELAGLACEEEVESRLIVQASETQQWSMMQGPLDEKCFEQLPSSHWTLLVQAVDHWHPEAAEFLQRFNFIPQWRVDDLMISYSVTGGGVGPHYDNYDVFLLQASGQREWQFGGEFDESSPRQDNQELMLLSEWEAEQTVTLNPGDMLYIPPRVGHNGIALTDDCTTYSVGFRAPSHGEILQHFSDFVSQDLSAELRYQDADLQAQPQSGEMTAAAPAKVRQILKQYIDQPGIIEQWFGCFMTEHKYPEAQQQLHLDNSVAEIIEALQQSQQLCKIPGTRLAFQTSTEHPLAGAGSDEDSMLFYVNGMCCQITREQQTFMIGLTENDCIDSKEVLSSQARIELMANLIKIGAYELV